MNSKYPEREIPLGWNALVNHDAKTVLLIGKFEAKGKLFSALELVNKPTQEELDAHVATLAGYKVNTPPAPKPKAQS